MRSRIARRFGLTFSATKSTSSRPRPRLEAVESRLLLSAYTLSTVATFVGKNGADPVSALVADTNGNLYGTTAEGGASNLGTVFEIAKGSNAITTLASFGGEELQHGGATPQAGVTLDAAGNLYGTTQFGGANGAGTVFEIVKGSNALTTLVSLTSADGTSPSAPLTVDASGNLYGTTSGSTIPSTRYGTVFEIAKGSTALTVLAAFNGTDGANSHSPLTLDAEPNLYDSSEGPPR